MGWLLHLQRIGEEALDEGEGVFLRLGGDPIERPMLRS